jgi:hypothetical protein
MAKFARRSFIKAGAVAGIAVGAPALLSPLRRSALATGTAAALSQAVTLSSSFNLNGAYKRGEAML